MRGEMQEGQKVALEGSSGGIQLQMSVAQAGETCRRISCPNLWVPSEEHLPLMAPYSMRVAGVW